jgi:tetratricopeptide (TPR) repeat protein
MRSFFVQVLLAIGLTGLPGFVVLAESESSYEDAIRHAVEEYSLAHWTEARFFFARAHTLSPNARTLRGLGMTCYESRNYVEAIGFFKQALASAEQPLTGKMRTDITQLLQQSERVVTRVVVALEPANADLEVDHTPHERAADGVLLLDPGEHALSASAAGHIPEQHKLNAQGGELRVELRLRPREAATPMLSARPVQRQRSGSSDLAPYIVIGAGAAALVAGGVLVGIAAADKHAVEHAEEGATWPELEPRYHRGRTFFPVGFALMGVGLAGVAAGLTWKLWPSAHERAPSAQLRVLPLGMALSGAF